MPIQTALDSISQNQGSPFGFKNRIINGGMVIDQRNAGASVTLTNQGYGLDRWTTWYSQSSKYTIQQNQGSVTPPTGFTNYQGVTSSSAYSVVSSDYFGIGTKIEGYNIADLGWGTSTASTVTLSFWVRSSLTGNFGVVLRNNDGSYYYASLYTINSSNTWEYKIITIPGCQTGTWNTTNGIGLFVMFGLGTGTNQTASSNNTWINGGVLGANGATSLVGTNGATFYITGVQLEKGNQATSFDWRPYGTELQLCQRYYQRISGGGNTRHAVSGNGGNTNCFPTVFFRTSMRAAPSFSYSALSDFVIEGFAGGQGTPTGMSYNAGTTECGTINCSGQSGITGSGGNLLGQGSGAWTAWSAEI